MSKRKQATSPTHATILDQLQEIVLRSDGIALPTYQSKTASVLAVHIELGNNSADAYLEHPLVADHAAVTVLTPPEALRPTLTLIFKVPMPLEGPSEIRDLMRALPVVFQNAVPCSDTSTIYRAPESATIEVRDTELTADHIEMLSKLGAEEKRSAKQETGKPYLRSSVRLRFQEPLLSAFGVEITLDQVGNGHRVHCPIHVGQHPTAKTIVFEDGQRGVICDHCRRTYVVTWTPPRYDFNRFEAIVRELAKAEDNPSDPSVRFISERYLPAIAIGDSGVSCVSSPKGTGKTEALREVVVRARQASKNVLLIGHRSALLQSMSDRLGLVCYLDPIEEDEEPVDSEGEGAESVGAAG